jgi:hypothetical protein
MKFGSTMSATRQINWYTIYRRGFAAAALTIFLGPAVGGLMFGVIADVNHIILAVRGQIPGPPATFVDELFFVFLWPLATALAALLVPGAWLAVAIAALYIAPRVGITGRMTWAETVVLAIICAAATGNVYQMDFLSANSSFERAFLTSALCAALALRYLAGRLGFVY